MRKDKNKNERFWTTKQAHAYAKEQGFVVVPATIVNWIQDFNLGWQPGGIDRKIYVYPEKFKNFLKDKKEN